MIPLAVFLHTVMVIALGPVLAGVIRLARHGGGWRTLITPTRSVSAGLRASGQPPIGKLAVLSLAIVAGLLVPLFSSEAVLGFLGDGFTALLLLTGLSIGRLPLRMPTVLSVAAALWTLGTLSGSTDLAQTMASWEADPVTLCLLFGLGLAVIPLMTPEAPSPAELASALDAWIRSTLQLGWLAFGMLAIPLFLPLTSGLTLLVSLLVFLAKFVIAGAVTATFAGRWPKLPFAEIGCAFSLLALGLAKLGI